jgi:hypothetical protein
MEDKELLELAAKAEGNVTWDCFQKKFRKHIDRDGTFLGVEWNPLEDDGDALRLAVKLHMTIDLHWLDKDEISVYARKAYPVERSTDHFSAVRKCIVRAAAEIGKGGE